METVPYSGRRQLVFPTTTDKVEAETSVFEKKKKGCIVLSPTHSYSVRARKITDKILRAMEEEGGGMSTKHLEWLKWEVVVAKVELSACCAAGGKIMINALLLFSFRKDEEIATVIGHEVVRR